MASIGTWKKRKIPRLQLASCFYLKVPTCRFKVKENTLAEVLVPCVQIPPDNDK